MPLEGEEGVAAPALEDSCVAVPVASIPARQELTKVLLPVIHSPVHHGKQGSGDHAGLEIVDPQILPQVGLQSQHTAIVHDRLAGQGEINLEADTHRHPRGNATGREHAGPIPHQPGHLPRNGVEQGLGGSDGCMEEERQEEEPCPDGGCGIEDPTGFVRHPVHHSHAAVSAVGGGPSMPRTAMEKPNRTEANEGNEGCFRMRPRLWHL